MTSKEKSQKQDEFLRFLTGICILGILIAIGYSFIHQTQDIEATNESSVPVHERSSLWRIDCIRRDVSLFSVEEPLIVDDRVRFIDAYTGQTTSAPAAICIVASPTNPEIQWKQPE